MASVTAFRHTLPAAALSLLAATCWAGTGARTALAAQGGPKLEGPFVHENLDVYLILGRETQAGRKLLPLARALSENKVVVRETGSVNQLTVENVSDEDVYVQAGEIVKGGKQDRVLGTDLILPRRSGKVEIASHCVEHGRWQKRGDEAADRFSSSAANAAGKQLKLANYRGSQSQVWEHVEAVQKRLESKLGASVQAPASRSSLQLTLENERVRSSVQGYVRALRDLPKKHAGALGYAFAINGEINSAEVYGSQALFAELWPKLLQASAVEAVAERQDLAAHTPPTLAAVQAFLTAAERGVAGAPATGPLAQSRSRESEATLLVETREKDSTTWIHRSYVSK